jgi:hypothetical protein
MLLRIVHYPLLVCHNGASSDTTKSRGVQVIRRTEAHIGTARFSGFELGTGRLLEVLAHRRARFTSLSVPHLRPHVFGRPFLCSYADHYIQLIL